MNIKLEKGIYLESDETQFAIKREVGVNKKGETTYKILGYYTNFEQELQGYVRHKTRVSKATTLQQAINEIRALKNHITNLAKGVANE